MRELTICEMEQVNGGENPLLILAGIVGAAVGGGVGLMFYATIKGCDSSMEVTTESFKIEVDCPEK